jgi:hypothetical protein
VLGQKQSEHSCTGEEGESGKGKKRVEGRPGVSPRRRGRGEHGGSATCGHPSPRHTCCPVVSPLAPPTTPPLSELCQLANPACGYGKRIWNRRRNHVPSPKVDETSLTRLSPPLRQSDPGPVIDWVDHQRTVTVKPRGRGARRNISVRCGLGTGAGNKST